MKFKIEVVISAVYGILLCDFNEVWDCLNYLSGSDLYNSQLPRAQRECLEPVLRQHPFLAEIDLKGITPENYLQRVQNIKCKYPNELELTPLNLEPRNPLQELQEIIRK